MDYHAQLGSGHPARAVFSTGIAYHRNQPHSPPKSTKIQWYSIEFNDFGPNKNKKLFMKINPRHLGTIRPSKGTGVYRAGARMEDRGWRMVKNGGSPG
jgi:hypothetical protein